MSYYAQAPSHTGASKVAHLTRILRSRWAQARLTDRQLMEMRTNLSRHSG
jgi:hypothetical protein